MRPDRCATMGVILLSLMAPFLAGAQEPSSKRPDINKPIALTHSANGIVIAEAWLEDITVQGPSTNPDVIARFKEPDGPVRALAIRPDGRALASGGDGKVVRVSELKSRKEIALLKGHDGGITCLAFAPDGQALASGSLDSSAIVWDVAAGKERVTLARHTSAVTALAFSRDGHRLATGSRDWTAKVWDVASGKLLQSLEGHQAPIVALAFSPDGQTLATTSRDGFARIWDLDEASQKFRLKAHAGSSGPLIFLPDGRSLIAGGMDGALRRWDVADGHVQTALLHAHTGPIFALALSPDGTRLTSFGDVYSWTWDIAQKLAPKLFAAVETKVRWLALSPDGKTLASSTTEGQVQFWDPERGRLRGKPMTLDSKDVRLAFSPDGRILGTLPKGAVLRFWDVETGREQDLLAALPNQSIRCFTFGPRGRSLATVGSRMTVWNFDNEPPFRVFPRSTGLVHAIAFSQDGQTIAAARGDGSLVLWDVAKGVTTAKLTGHEAAVSCLAYAPDGRTLASGSWDRTVRLWNPRDGKPRAVLDGATRPLTDLAFTRDGKTIASAADGEPTIRLYDVEKGVPTATLTLPDAVQDKGFSSLAFSPDGLTLYTGGDRGIAAWDVSPSSKVLDRHAGESSDQQTPADPMPTTGGVP